jgi:hypothetical protein
LIHQFDDGHGLDNTVAVVKLVDQHGPLRGEWRLP